MTTCAHCHQTKGKRQCPALGDWICPRCCGQHRLRQIHCPSTCRHLKQHERYQSARVAEAFHAAWLQAIQPLLRRGGREGLDFLIAIEFALYRHVRAHPATTDAELSDGLQFLRRQLSPVQVVEAAGNALGKALAEEAQAYRQAHPAFDPDAAQAAVDALLGLLPEAAEDPRQGIHGLIGHLEAHFDLSSLRVAPAEDEVVVPRIITPE